MEQYPPSTNHDECSTDKCVWEEIDESSYTPRHVESDCGCELYGPKLNAIFDTLDAGNFPMLEITGHDLDSITVNIIPYQPDIPYG